MKFNRHQLTNVAAGLVLFVVFVFGALSSASVSAVPITEEASGILTTNLLKVFEIAREIGNPEILQAILLQESNGGLATRIGNKAGPINKRSYGLMQVQIVAARSILLRIPALVDEYFPDRDYHSITDKEVVRLLLDDDEANIKIAAYHFDLYLQMCDGNLDRAVAAYNAGIGGVKRIPNPSKFGYVMSIKAKLKTVRPFNLLYGLELTNGS